MQLYVFIKYYTRGPSFLESFRFFLYQNVVTKSLVNLNEDYILID